MSLETVIAENTQAIQKLIATLQAGAATTQGQAAAAAEEPAGKKSAAQTADTARIAPEAAGAVQSSKAKNTKASQPDSQPAAEGNDQKDAGAKTAASAATDGTAQSAAAGDAVTYQQVAAAITTLGRSAGRDAAIAVLAKFGAKKGTDLTPDQYADVIAACAEPAEA